VAEYEENQEPEKKEEQLEDLAVTPQEWKFLLGGQPHMLKELYGTQRDRYMNSQQENMKFDGKGNVTGLKTFEDHLYKQDESGAYEKMVPAGVIRTFPASTQKRLYDWLLKASGLDVRAEEKAGNS
jgi:hypothetical protein